MLTTVYGILIIVQMALRLSLTQQWKEKHVPDDAVSFKQNVWPYTKHRSGLRITVLKKQCPYPY